MEAVIGQAEKVNNEKWTLRQKLVGIIVSPRQTFEYLAKNPDWVTPIVITIIGIVILTLAIAPPIIKAAINSSDLNLSNRSIGLLTTSGVLFGSLFAIVSWFLSIIVLHFVCSILSNEKVEYRTTISILGFANLPNIFRAFLISFGVFLTGPRKLLPGLSALTPDITNVFVKNILASIDIFSLWALVLQIFFIALLFGFSKRKSFIICGLFWFLGIIIQSFSR